MFSWDFIFLSLSHSLIGPIYLPFHHHHHHHQWWNVIEIAFQNQYNKTIVYPERKKNISFQKITENINYLPLWRFPLFLNLKCLIWEFFSICIFLSMLLNIVIGCWEKKTQPKSKKIHKWKKLFSPIVHKHKQQINEIEKLCLSIFVSRRRTRRICKNSFQFTRRHTQQLFLFSIVVVIVVVVVVMFEFMNSQKKRSGKSFFFCSIYI